MHVCWSMCLHVHICDLTSIYSVTCLQASIRSIMSGCPSAYPARNPARPIYDILLHIYIQKNISRKIYQGKYIKKTDVCSFFFWGFKVFVTCLPFSSVFFFFILLDIFQNTACVLPFSSGGSMFL